MILALLKRFEIWMLFGLVGVALWWGLQAPEQLDEVAGEAPAPGAEESGPAKDSTTPKERPLFRVEEVRAVEPEGGGTLLEITVLGRSGTEDLAILDEDTMVLTDGEGERVPRFFLPFDEAPTLDPVEESRASLKFWLAEPAGELRLSYQGRWSVVSDQWSVMSDHDQ